MKKIFVEVIADHEDTRNIIQVEIFQVEIFGHKEKVCNFFGSTRSVSTGSLPNNRSDTKDQHDDHNEHNVLLIVDPCGATRTTVKIKSSISAL